MNKHLKFYAVLCVSVTVLLLLFVFLFPLTVRSEDHGQIHIPTLEEVRANGYPTNEKGETYGPDFRELDIESPDLELVIAENGAYGYIRASEIPGASVSTPEEAAEYMANPYLYPHDINVYLQDGTTVVGTFHVLD